MLEPSSVFQYRGGESIAMIKKSIEIGYRHFDTAYLYGNELEVGEGIRAKIADGSVSRSEIFISTKVFNLNVLNLQIFK